MNDGTPLPLVMAVTGASGAPYAVRLLEALVAARQPVQLIISDHGLRLLRTETDVGTVAEDAIFNGVKPKIKVRP